jgi:putative ABC transport system ATP-binding protein
MPQSFYGFILKYSKKDQIVLLVLALVSYPFLYYSYDQPKQIINHIKNVTVHRADKGEIETYPADTLFGVPLDAVQYLAWLCFVFLTLTLINSGFKYYINVYKGRLGERMLRRLRYELYSRILRFPLPHFKRVSSGEIIPMITSEVEPLGGFIGDAFVQPLFQGGLLVVPLVFILVQDPILGAAALAFYPFQMYVIPRIQRRVNQLAKRRVQTVRQLADRIGDTIAGVQDVHANDASLRERADFSHRLGTIYQIRYDIYRLKFLAKFLNNSIDKLTPFLFYAIGGYLAFQGRVDIGALVAVIAAQKDLAAPWKELLDYYQQKEDVRIKYEQVVSQFEPPDMTDPAILDAEPEAIEPLKGPLAAMNVVVAEGGAVKYLDGVTLTIPLDTRIAVVGDGASGKDELPMVIARLLMPTSGSLTLNGQKYASLPAAVIGRRMAYIGPQPHLIASTVRENLLYGLKHRPLRAPERDDEAKRLRERVEREATEAGNTTADIHADWVDYGAAGVEGPAALTERAIEMLRLVGMENDVYLMGLRGRADAAQQKGLAEAILEARRAFKARLSGADLAELVEPFDADRYNTNATLAENLLFGTPVGSAFAEDSLATNAYMMVVLHEAKLDDELVEMGRKVAETMVELFSGLGGGNELFEQYSFIGADDLPEFQRLLGRLQKEGAIAPEDRARLLALPFRLVPARHRLSLIDDALMARVIEARRIFAKNLPEKLKGAIEFFDERSYNAASSIQDNILFGKLAYGHAHAEEQVGKVLADVVDSLKLRTKIMEVGLEFQVGVAGSRLNLGQRQKLAIARAALKRPDVMILNQATSALDGGANARIMEGLLKRMEGRGVIWALHRASLAKPFEQVIVMRAGRVAGHGTYAELEKGEALRELLDGE